MNLGELKLQNFFFNSQLQLNNDWFGSKENISNFDNILKDKSIERSAVGRDHDSKGFTEKSKGSNLEVRFNNERSGFDASRNVGDLKESIREGIAQKKFEKENEGLHLGQDLSEQVKELNELQKQIKELEKAIEQDLDLTEDAEALEQIAAMMGIDVETLIVELTQATSTDDVKTELFNEIVELIETEVVDTKTLVQELKDLKVELPEQTLVEFEKVLDEVIEELPEKIEQEAEVLVEKNAVETLTTENVPEDVKVQQQAAVEVANEVAKEVKAPIAEVEQIQTKETPDVQVVDTKEKATNNENMSQQDERPILSLEVKEKSTVQQNNNINFEDQVNIMKSENSLISSAKSQPRALLARSVMNQVVQGTKMSVNMSDQGSEILVKLNPKNLGNVSLKMAFDKGTLLAQIQVENQTVKGIIESNLDDLKSALQEEGYKIGDLDVSVNKENTGQNEQSFSQQFKKQFKQESFEEVEERLLQEQNLVNDKEVNYLA